MQKLDVLQKGVINKLHAGWFTKCTPGEFISRGLFIKLKGLLCGDPTERGEILMAAGQLISPTQAA